jgi:hypothetical protein
MVTGYGGTYRGVVTDDADPLEQSRLGVVVPDVYGEAPVWAAASRGAGSGGALPAIGDLVSISFEHGDTDFPIWESGSGSGAGDSANSPSAGYVGKYRGIVMVNDDPMQEHRIEVTVPDVDSQPVWATPSDDVRYVDLPDVGSEVWIEFESGDPAYPRWVGLV